MADDSEMVEVTLIVRVSSPSPDLHLPIATFFLLIPPSVLVGVNLCSSFVMVVLFVLLF